MAALRSGEHPAPGVRASHLEVITNTSLPFIQMPSLPDVGARACSDKGGSSNWRSPCCPDVLGQGSPLPLPVGRSFSPGF